MKLLIFVAGAFVLVSPAAAQDMTCPGFEAGRANPATADRLYVARAISIVDAALGNDRAALEVLVAPDAKFEAWRGDSGGAPRSRGLDGLIEMFRRLAPVSFQSESTIHGPIAVIQPECAWDVRVLFRTAEPGEGASYEFKFRDGLLVSAIGEAVVLMEDRIGTRPDEPDTPSMR